MVLKCSDEVHTHQGSHSKLAINLSIYISLFIYLYINQTIFLHIYICICLSLDDSDTTGGWEGQGGQWGQQAPHASADARGKPTVPHIL